MSSLLPMPFQKWYTYPGHGGIDFPQNEGVSAPAIADGTVTFLGYWGRDTPKGPAGGITRTLTLANGLKIMYCHLRDFGGPKVGQRVRVGDHFGPVGNTGYSTGPHLHIEMWLNGVAQDEWRWMDPNNWIGKGSPAGGGGAPLPPLTPTGRKKKMALGVLYSRDTNDQARQGIIIDTETGFRSRFGHFPTSYANDVAAGFGLAKAGAVTLNQLEKIWADHIAFFGTTEDAK